MNKIFIFYGSNHKFSELIPKENRNLSDVVMELDNDRKKSVVYIKGLSGDNQDTEEEEKKLKVENFVINSDEYCSVREHVITNFTNFIANIDIDTMYIQNPPLHISEQLYRIYGDKNIITEETQKYAKVSEKIVKKIFSEYDGKIIGQERAKMALLQALYPLVNSRKRKPVIILFYGDSGVGKTETAQYLAKLLNGKLLRKQFSMYQNNQFTTYLFGGSYDKGSFAKDLLDRDSNVILLDEFDKANSTFHSAFYQLFDEGIYEDQNYKVYLNNAIIICTSNYKDEEEIRKNLGNAIYNRFDSIIHFEDLSIDAKCKIADKIIDEVVLKYQKNNVEMDVQTLQRLKMVAVNRSNAREIQHLIENTFALLAIRKICQ